MYSEHEKEMIQSAKSGSFRQLTVKGAMMNILVDTEVQMWFYIGERIGKRGDDTGDDTGRQNFNI